MKSNSSRRNFLAAGLALPAAGFGSVASPAPQAQKTHNPQPQAGSGLRYRTLGKTGLKVTEVGFGCMITSDGSVIEKAADIGITYFDTARGYQNGNNERMVGAALKSKRKNLVLSTKTAARDKAGALEHLDTSLKELSTDYIDIWYLHAKSSPSAITDDLMEAQEIAKKAGKIRFAGFSTHGSMPEMLQHAVKVGKFDVVLTTYNFTLGSTMDEALQAARKAGIGIVAMKVMAGGFRRTKPGDKLYDTWKKEGAMLAALKWVLKSKLTDTTIPSITDMDQLDEDLKAMTTPFTDIDEKVLAKQLDYIRPLYCRSCGQCSGVCPKGLPVSDVIRFASYAEGYGQFALGRERFLELSEEQRQIRCSDCSSCPIQCPNGVRVAERLIRAQELFA